MFGPLRRLRRYDDHAPYRSHRWRCPACRAHALQVSSEDESLWWYTCDAPGCALVGTRLPGLAE